MKRPSWLSSSELPEFLAGHASDAASETELAELVSKLSSLEEEETGAAGLARGRVRLLATVSNNEERFAPFFDKLAKFFDLSVEGIRAVFARAEQESEWQQGPLPWVSLFHLDGGPAVAGLDTGFVRLKKGMPFPRHRHLGPEHVLILEGGYFDHDQRWYGPGDFHDMEDATEHALQMGAEVDVYLAIIIREQPEVLGT
ncbi:MAG: cupin domain-containing protein [Polyangiaceae bacterium]